MTEDIRQSAAYGSYMEGIGWKVVKMGKMQLFVRKLGMVGIGKIQRVRGALLWEEVKPILEKERVFMCKLEPGDDPRGWDKKELGRLGFRQDNWPLLATKTLRINLKREVETIKGDFKKDARYSLRKTEEENFPVEMNQWEKFYELWKKANKIKGLWTPGKKDYNALTNAFREKCFSITVGGVAGCLVLMHDRVAYYYYSGSLPQGKAVNAPYAVIWEAMKEAKKRGCEVWDFEGIFDSRWPNPGWRGFSHFKKSFGGEEVEFPGCFTKWRLPI